jgi:hypothetical protein
MIDRTLAIFVAGFCLAGSALADEAPPLDDAGGRYSFSKVADGFLRLDTQTGDVSLCSQRTVGWACQAAPDDRAVLENEITRLRAENGALKKEILAHGLALPSGAVPGPPGARDNDTSLRLPSNAEVSRMVAFVNRVWHRLVEVIARAQKQVLNKS